MLEITIPTFNRPCALRNTVDRLLPQMGPDDRLLVVDNASDVPVTLESIGAHRSRWPEQVRVIRQPFNVGGSANIVSCFLLAKEKFIWLLADDDVIELDALRKIRDYLSRFPKATFISFQFRERRDRDTFAHGADGLLETTVSWTDIVFISNTVFDVEACCLHARQGYHYAYAYAPHVAMLLFSLGDRGLSVLATDRIVIGNAEGTTGTTWSVAQMAVSRMAILDLPLTGPSRKRLAKKIYADFGVMNHAFLTYLGMALRGRKDSAIFYYSKVYQENLRFEAYFRRLVARVSIIAMRIPQFTYRVLCRRYGASRIDNILKRESGSIDW